MLSDMNYTTWPINVYFGGAKINKIHILPISSMLHAVVVVAAAADDDDGDDDDDVQCIGVARGCSGCTCTPRAEKKF